MSSWRDTTDDQLGAALRELGKSLDSASGTGLAAAVRARLEAEAGGRARPPSDRRSFRRPMWRGRPVGWQLAGLAACLVLAVVVTLAMSPSARHAMADWLGLRGVDIDYGDRPPSSVAGPVTGATLGLGERVDLAEARRRAGFPLLLPPESQTGPPDQAYVSPTPSGWRVSFVWLGNERLARVPGSDVGLLLTQFKASVDDVSVRKLVHSGVRVEQLQVAGERGFWFEGEPHQLFFSDEHGHFLEDRARLAANTLVWEHGDLSLRLESALSRDDAIRLAESVRA